MIAIQNQGQKKRAAKNYAAMVQEKEEQQKIVKLKKIGSLAALAETYKTESSYGRLVVLRAINDIPITGLLPLVHEGYGDSVPTDHIDLGYFRKLIGWAVLEKSGVHTGQDERASIIQDNRSKLVAKGPRSESECVALYYRDKKEGGNTMEKKRESNGEKAPKPRKEAKQWDDSGLPDSFIRPYQGRDFQLRRSDGGWLLDGKGPMILKEAMAAIMLTNGKVGGRTVDFFFRTIRTGNEPAKVEKKKEPPKPKKKIKAKAAKKSPKGKKKGKGK